MHSKTFLTGIFLAVAFLGLDVVAMVAEPTRVVVWRKGESIAGEEFVAANEAIVDYIATLRRPTDPLKGIRYNCVAKVRTIRPTVQRIGGTGSENEWVYVQTVYELRDCVEIP